MDGRDQPAGQDIIILQAVFGELRQQSIYLGHAGLRDGPVLLLALYALKPMVELLQFLNNFRK